MSSKLPPCLHGTKCFANDNKRCTVLKDTFFWWQEMPVLQNKGTASKRTGGKRNTMKLKTIKHTFIFAGFIGFLLALGSAGGLDCETLTFGKSLALALVSLVLIGVSFVAIAFIEYLQSCEVQADEYDRESQWLQFDFSEQAEEVVIPQEAEQWQM